MPIIWFSWLIGVYKSIGTRLKWCNLEWMSMKNKKNLSVIIWMATLITIGAIIGSFTKPEISAWYSTLNRSPFTPPNYIFPIAWTILYGMIGACGSIIWHARSSQTVKLMKILYIIQLVLNWSWTPLFFNYHLVGLSLFVLCCMDSVVGLLIWLAYRKIKLASLLLIPYLFWILFATYLNAYIWQHTS